MEAGPSFLELLPVGLLSPLLAEVKALGALLACSKEINHLMKMLENDVWQGACALSKHTGYAPRCVTEGMSSWRSFLYERTPGADGQIVRVLGEHDLQVNEQLDWAALVVVIGCFRNGKSALIERLVRQEAPGQTRGSRIPPLGTGIRACVLEALGTRGRLRLFEIEERQIHLLKFQLRKADAIFVVCDQTEGVNGAADSMRLLSSVRASSAVDAHRPCFLVLSKSDAVGAHRDIHSAVRMLQLEASDALSDCEVVTFSATDGSGMDVLLHLLAWRLLARCSQSRQHLLKRSHVGGCKLLHRTAGAMNPAEVLGALRSAWEAR